MGAIECRECRCLISPDRQLCARCVELIVLRERCERAEEAQTHLIYLFDCGKISLPETREIVERLKQQSLGAKEQA
ncbi:hypothetical protein UFOVP124_7 [uncultured Caudovirales phage]|uniref:Uncharacterized protein n=1 Tax=uncultured Caudovirales phage TaxID=2100421 RepID=A0A6J5L7F4_9CAUD|nr:hypothetical protein UFOVP124_7 [uncultured Caudovirales phage]